MPLSSRHEVTVEWGDCDPAGIVYYPSYFRWTYHLFLAAGLKRDDYRISALVRGVVESVPFRSRRAATTSP